MTPPDAPLLRPRWAAFRFWVAILSACTAAGVLYGSISAGGRPEIGAVYGIFCGGAVMLFEHGLVLPALRDRLRRLPWLASVAGAEAAYLVMTWIGGAVAGLLLVSTGALQQSFAEAVVLRPATTLYALAVSGLVITLTRMRDLVGAEAFRNILLGRYHRPVQEERIFAFIDLIGSTAYAQAHGDLAAQRYLGAIFAALAEPVRRHGGAIDDYVGDMARITWPLGAGVRGARCVACIFAVLEAVARDAEAWRRDFGEVPRFRAALHGGGVVTAEIGVDRHKISYFGDVVNTTGRIEALCRALDAPLLISADLLGRIPALPAGIRARPLGDHAVKGRGQMLTVFGLEAAQPAGREAGQGPTLAILGEAV
jgi:adenylate cyclase